MTAPFVLPPVDTVLVSASPGETRIASLRGGQAWELVIARDSQPSLVGNVYLGRVRRVEPGLGAAFLDIGEAEAGFLPLAAAARPSEGDAVVVQVTSDAFDGKGPALSSRIAIAGRYLVYAPNRPGLAAGRRIPKDRRQHLQGLLRDQVRADEGVVLRTAAAACSEDAVLAELARLRVLWRGIADRAGDAAPALLHEDLGPLSRFLRDGAPAGATILFDDRRTLAAADAYARQNAEELLTGFKAWREPRSLFETHGVEEEIEAALQGSSIMRSGGLLHVETTRALTAIDVDSAHQVPSAGMLADLGLEAATEVARVVRLRNLAGLIVIDFAGRGDARARAAIEARLRGSFGDDVAERRILPMSELGLVEMSRQRRGPSLPDILAGSCTFCGGSGRVAGVDTLALNALRAILREADSAPGGRPVIGAAPEVLERLRTALSEARCETEARLGQEIEFRAGPGRIEMERNR